MKPAARSKPKATEYFHKAFRSRRPVVEFSRYSRVCLPSVKGFTVLTNDGGGYREVITRNMDLAQGLPRLETG